MTSGYDAIAVGTRCAGSPTAMLLSRLGHRVLLMDRSHFPSEAVSAKPWHRWTSRASSFRPEPPMRQLFEAMAELRDLTDRYAGVYAETVKPRDLFGPLLGQPA